MSISPIICSGKYKKHVFTVKGVHLEACVRCGTEKGGSRQLLSIPEAIDKLLKAQEKTTHSFWA